MGSKGSFAKAVQKIIGRSLRETGAALKQSGEVEVCHVLSGDACLITDV
jgi:hypothetical protein